MQSIECWQVLWSSYLYRAEHINNVVMLELFNILTSHQQEPARLVIITNGIVTDIFRFNF